MNPLRPPPLLSPHQSKVFLFSFTERDQQTDMLEVFYSVRLFFLALAAICFPEETLRRGFGVGGQGTGRTAPPV